MRAHVNGLPFAWMGRRALLAVGRENKRFPGGNPSLNTLLTDAGKPWSNAQSSRKGVSEEFP